MDVQTLILLVGLGVSCAQASPQLSVVISSGQPRLESNNHIREIAVFLSGLNSSLVSNSSLVIAKDAEFRQVVKRMSVYDEIEDDVDPTSGRVLTGLIISPTYFNISGAPAEECIGYFARLEFQGRVIADNCLRVQPRWMEMLVRKQPKVGDLFLNELAIPGTHNAGSYKVYDPPDESFVTWYRDCQEEDVYTQLLYGIRFLDIRPGLVTINNTKREFWVFHSAIRTENKLTDVLRGMRRFLDEFRTEVVFVDFHEFPWGFKTPQDYEALGDLVEQYLGSYILHERPHTVSLSDAVEKNTRAVVTFERNEALQKRFISGVQHIWPDTDNIDILQSRIQRMQRGEIKLFFQ